MANPTFATYVNGEGDVASGTTVPTPGSITPSPDSVLIVWVLSFILFGSPNIPTVSGGGLTYTRQSTNTFSTTIRVSTFTAPCGSSPGTFVVTAAFGGQNQSGGAAIRVMETNGADPTTPWVQSKFGTGTSTAPSSGNFAAGVAAGNSICAFVFANSSTATFTPGVGYTIGYNSTVLGRFSETMGGTNTKADGTLSASVLWSVDAMEIQAAPAGFDPTAQPSVGSAAQFFSASANVVMSH